MAEEILYGQGIASVVEPNMPMVDAIVEDVRYKGQLLARETKLSSGVLATVSVGFAIGFVLAILMMLGPFAFMGGMWTMAEDVIQDNKPVVPVAVVDSEQLRDVMARLDKIEEKLEFYSSEKYMRAGKSIGRDLGVAYGVCAALILVLAYILFVYAGNWEAVI